ncbi:MAG TPA: hypothetical protein VK563_22185 [Puia sp.]|nr:hypothetical protein [Puia sp.]
MAYFFLAFIFFVALGFYYPYFSLFPEFKAVTFIIHIHATALLLWVVVIIVQPFLIAYKKFKAHRVIGRFTYLLMPLIIISSIGVLRQQYHEGVERHMTSSASLKTLFTSATELLSIVVFYLLAIFSILKQNVAFHMRYMICLALVFIPPSLGRTLGYWLFMTQYHTYNISILICIAILIMLILYDRQKKLNYTPYIVGLLVFSIFHVFWFAIGHPI